MVESEAAPFDAEKEYRKLLDEIEFQKNTRKRFRRQIQNDDVTSLEIYQTLMQKEDHVLDAINRVVNDASVRKYQDVMLTTDLSNMTVKNIIMRTIGSIHQLFEDLLEARKPHDVVRAFTNPKRLPFYGVAILFIATFLTIILIMS